MAARLRFLVLAVLAAAACSVPAANAGLIGGLLSNCPTGGSQVFAPWGDSYSYLLASNGGFESGSWGWSLSGGATVVSGNQPFFGSGTRSLSLPSGSSAMSPTVCLGTQQLYIRMFGKDLNGTDSGLRVRVYFYGLLNNQRDTIRTRIFLVASLDQIVSLWCVVLVVVRVLSSWVLSYRI